MDILPAIDLRNGKVVRLQQGDYDNQTIYGDNPVTTARGFDRAGAKWIHIVDLDAAKTGQPVNHPSVWAIRQVIDAKIELGGGIRTTDMVRETLDRVADRVVISSAALEDWQWFESLLNDDTLPNERLVLGLDAREGRLAIHGWIDHVETTAIELAGRVRGSGLGAIVYTDIARDGMLTGVNIEATAELVNTTDVPIIASGGVSSLEDIRQCKNLGCGGVILGKSIYEGRIDLAEAIAEAQD